LLCLQGFASLQYLYSIVYSMHTSTLYSTLYIPVLSPLLYIFQYSLLYFIYSSTLSSIVYSLYTKTIMSQYSIFNNFYPTTPYFILNIPITLYSVLYILVLYSIFSIFLCFILYFLYHNILYSSLYITALHTLFSISQYSTLFSLHQPHNSEHVAPRVAHAEHLLELGILKPPTTILICSLKHLLNLLSRKPLWQGSKDHP